MPKTTAKKTTAKMKMAAAALEESRMTLRRLINFVKPDEGEPKPLTLGRQHGVVIVCAAARTSPTNLERTLAELGRDGESFQSDVFDGVTKAGYFVKIDDIDHAQDTKLSRVVTEIQNAPLA